jgi:hypothetical protein
MESQKESAMRLLTALAAAAIAATVAIPAAEAQSRKKRELVVNVKPRSYLNAGTQVLPGSYQGYSLGQTPFRPSDSAIPTGSPQSRLLPGRFGPAW